MRSNNNIDFAIFKAFFGFRFLFSCAESVHIRNINRKIFQTLFKTSVMLESQNRCGNQNRNLFAVCCRFERRTNCNFRFPESDIATDQTVHHAIIFHIFFYIQRGFFLVWCIFVKEACFQLILQVGIRRILESFSRFPFRIEFYQVESDLLNFCLGFLF